VFKKLQTVIIFLHNFKIRREYEKRFIAPYLMPENFNLGTQMVAWLKAIGLTMVYSGIMTAVVYFVSALLTGGARVDEETELKGLDTQIHGEEAINL